MLTTLYCVYCVLCKPEINISYLFFYNNVLQYLKENGGCAMNRTVIVTGGAKGIGAAISSLFAKSGYNVIVNYNTSEAAAKALCAELTTNGYSCLPYKADISNSTEVQSLFKFAKDSFGKVDVVVNNAGISQQKLITDITDMDYNKMIATNLSGVFYCCREAAKYMIKEKNGSIINISSMWGISGASMEVHYSAAKAGVIGLTKALAKELGPSSIRVNAIAPGVIKTDMLNGFTKDDLQELSNATPLLRLGTPLDIAKTALFLASEDASFITGQVISVDGGFIV